MKQFEGQEQCHHQYDQYVVQYVEHHAVDEIHADAYVQHAHPLFRRGDRHGHEELVADANRQRRGVRLRRHGEDRRTVEVFGGAAGLREPLVHDVALHVGEGNVGDLANRLLELVE